MPFPLSSLSPVPLSSDPHRLLISRPAPVVQLHGNSAEVAETIADLLPGQPPGDTHPPNHPIGGGPDSRSDAQKDKDKNEGSLVLLQKIKTAQEDPKDQQRGEEEEDEEEGSKQTRKKSNLGVAEVMNSGFLPQSSSLQESVERWCEEEKVFPLKKRRGSFEVSIMEKDDKKVTNVRMKTKMNKKCTVQGQNGAVLVIDQKERKELLGELITDTAGSNSNNNTAVTGTGTKKRARGGALMEGSRCSRVNGRGWRCCQQTLVGYSLCEHHLGKGRLRSMTSVRSRSLATNDNISRKKKEAPPLLLSSSSSLVDENGAGGDDGKDEEEDDEKPLMRSKKRMKLGMVKARSISSLLGQPVAVLGEDDK